jgi:hypothetical protein
VNVDSNGKNKGLVSYNTRYGTSALKKHVTNKHVEEYRRWGLFVMQKSKDGGNERQVAKKQKMVKMKDKSREKIKKILNFAHYNIIT